MKTLINSIVSDLFFNHTHEHYDGLYVGGPNRAYATREDQCEAILKDATEFVEAYGKIGAIGEYTAQDFANDFMERL